MIVYRISKAKYASSLNASGIYGRWNSEGKKVIYTGGSAALSSLEVAVHRSGASLTSGDYFIAKIKIPDKVLIEEVQLTELTNINPEWIKPTNCLMTQHWGDIWLASLTSAVLKVPSAIIPMEFNYLLNVEHPDFSLILIDSIAPFSFDPRLKIDP